MGLKDVRAASLTSLTLSIKSDQNGIESLNIYVLCTHKKQDKIRPKWDWKFTYSLMCCDMISR